MTAQVTAMPRRPGPTADDFVQCKSDGHWWDALDEAVDATGRSVWRHYRKLRCVRCTTTQVQGLEWDGRVGARWYDWPDGYREATTGRGLGRAEARLLMVEGLREQRRRRGR